MTTVSHVFDIAAGLMDELSSSGASDHADTKDYRQRTVLILTALCGELYKFSDTCAEGEPGRRPVCPEITGFDSAVGLDDFLARTVLPYGLAAHLLVDESPASASFFLQRYQELIIRYATSVPSLSEPIDNLYGSAAPDSSAP